MNELQKMKIKFGKSKEIRVKQKGPQRKRTKARKTKGMKVKSESEVAQSYLTLCDPMDCRLPGSSIHGIFQASVLENLMDGRAW